MFWIFRHVLTGPLLKRPGRALLQVLAIAAGVSLGYGVNLINASALAEFSAGVRQFSGQADATVVGPREGFPEALFGTVAERQEVLRASPILETRLPVLLDGGTLLTLTIVGLDPLRAGTLSPALLPLPGDGGSPALLGDGVYLSAAARQRFGVEVGGSLRVQAGAVPVSLKVVGTLPGVRAGEVLGVMDIAYAQWRLGRLGELTRIDLQLNPGTNLEAFRRGLDLPPDMALNPPDAAESRLRNLSQAYRVNLNVLALVALFTGAFLVFSLQAQAIVVRRSQLAFLRVAGVTARSLQRLLLAESLLVGIVGSALGIGGGVLLARLSLAALGGDLGSGAFAGSAPALQFSPAIALGFFGLGILAAGAGGFVPARNVSRARPAAALKAGAEEDAFRPLSSPWPGVVLMVLAAILIPAPAINSIPVGAYVGIGMLLVGSIALQPRLARFVFTRLAASVNRRRWVPRAPMLMLAVTRLAQTPGSTAIGMAGIVASFALMIAMATMVMSLRGAVTDWLDRVLPADLYVRIGQVTTGAYLSDGEVELLRSHPAVARAEFSRFKRVALRPDQPELTIIVRPVDAADPGKQLPLAGDSLVWRPGMLPPVWVSEAVLRLHGARVGQPLTLPLAGAEHRFLVAGVWRDYARQFGSVVMRETDYDGITGDRTRTDAALWLKPGFAAPAVMNDLKQRLVAGSVAEFNEPQDLRRLSLRIFDRSFAITYALELVAVIIGLVGIAATFSAQTVARTREFGMLRHVGVTRSQVLGLLAWEGALVTGLALAVGLIAGLVVARVLVDVVNPVSFNWSMPFDPPVMVIAGLLTLLLAAATLTAVIAGRQAVSVGALRAVSDDW